MVPDDNLDTPKQIDKIICAEIPDKITNLAAYDIVIKFMLHGPCGDATSMHPVWWMESGQTTIQRNFLNLPQLTRMGLLLINVEMIEYMSNY